MKRGAPAQVQQQAADLKRTKSMDVVIVSAVRTPIGSFLGGLSSLSAVQLGAAAIKGALERISLDAELVEQVYFGHVLQAGAGQNPARQAAIAAGIPNTVPATTINKVCSSGMKATIIGAQTIALGDADVVVVGGMESMSNAPHYVHMRRPSKFGSVNMQDGLQLDGLTDAYDQRAMGFAADLCAVEHGISREQQDEYALSSYKRAADAWANGKFAAEVIPVEVANRRGTTVVSQDEDFSKVQPEKVAKLRAAFEKDGTVTAANASTLSDGAGAMVLMSAARAALLNLPVLATIKGYGDAAHDPVRFTTAPSKALPRAIQKAGLTAADVDFFEINEAFSVVALANMKLLGVPHDAVNVHGGAVALGHPLGCSGVRIIITLLHTLIDRDASVGAAGVCNGGGGASAIVISRSSSAKL